MNRTSSINSSSAAHRPWVPCLPFCAFLLTFSGIASAQTDTSTLPSHAEVRRYGSGMLFCSLAPDQPVISRTSRHPPKAVRADEASVQPLGASRDPLREHSFRAFRYVRLSQAHRSVRDRT
jgi:hypothetical protein